MNLAGIFLRAEPLRGAGSGFGGFFFAILGRSGSLKRMEKTRRDSGHFLDRCERILIFRHMCRDLKLFYRRGREADLVGG